MVGFALQDTLGNAFAGLAIQSEKPFNIGHWITVDEHEGRVAEVTWRATKLRTKTGNFVIVPNSEIAKAAITNYSEPAAPTRLYIDVGVSYDAPPNTVKAVVKEALQNCSLVLRAPAPDAMIHDFAASSIIYRVRFWIEDFELDEEAADQVRTSLYYGFRRRGIEIPYPIQVEYSKEEPVVDEAARAADRERLLASVDLFATLTDAQRRDHRRAHPAARLRRRRDHRARGGAGAVDVRGRCRPRGRDDRREPDPGRHDRAGRLLRRDVAPHR